MELDDLREVWSAHGRKLEQSLAVSEQVLRGLALRKVRWGLVPFQFWRSLEVVAGVVGLGALAHHVVAGEPGWVSLVAAGLVFVYGLVFVGASVSLLVGSLHLDDASPVGVMQERIARLKLGEYRALKWALLGGVVLWVPGLLVVFELVTGVDPWSRIPLGWLAANLAVGSLVLLIGCWWSRRFVERDDPPRWAQRLVDGTSSAGLRKAQKELADLRRFLRDE